MTNAPTLEFPATDVRRNYGFFGPESVCWRVWSHPTSVLGFQRAVSIETLDPNLTAAVVDMGGVYRNPQQRFQRTARYFVTSIFGDGETAVIASRKLIKVHDHVRGIEPLSGKPYSANDPESQLWIHLTAWHSILICYERFGPGPLSPEDDEQYWAECRIAAELQTCDPARVPRSREEVRTYFAEMRPRLALSEQGHALFHFLFRPSLRHDARLLSATFHTNSYAVATTMPQWIRRLAGIEAPRLLDAAAITATRAAMLAAMPISARMAALERIAPAARPIVEAALRGPAPLHPVVVTPQEAAQAVDAAS